jgi:hypothetical protein
MESTELRKLANDYLVPFFSGTAEIDQELEASTAHQERFAFKSPQTIAFKLSKEDTYRLHLRRSQAFAKLSKNAVIEMDVVEAFLDAVSEIESGLSEPYRNELLNSLQRRVVAKASAFGKDHAPVLLDAIDVLTRWGLGLYEGSPVSAGIGFRPGQSKSGLTLQDLAAENLSQVLSNGFDTLLTFNLKGDYSGIDSLAAPEAASPFAPFRYGAIAEWTKSGSVALVLNRLGEILAFSDGRLLFARRSGVWHFLAHEPIIQRMKVPRNPEVRTAVYESALDASFARSGACIGVVSQANLGQWKSVATARADDLSPATSTKAMALREIIQREPFHRLDRRVRQELLALDGAMLLDPNGQVLSAGTILHVPGGKGSGGGRQAAAIAASQLGLGIKVSQDGRITGYRGGSTVFALM